MYQHITHAAFGNGQARRIDRAGTAQFAAQRDPAAAFSAAAQCLIAALALRAALDIGEGGAEGAQCRQLLLE